MTATAIQKLAASLTKALETRKRDNGNEFVCLKDGSPVWMTEVIRSAHADKLPDDTTYAFIEKCADALADADEDAEPSDVILEIEPDIYTADLTAWLHARADHIFYLNEVLEECSGTTDGAQLLMAAQKKQIDEVGYALVSALENAEQMEDAEPEEERCTSCGRLNAAHLSEVCPFGIDLPYPAENLTEEQITQIEREWLSKEKS
jgi:hypothetical protein